MRKFFTYLFCAILFVGADSFASSEGANEFVHSVSDKTLQIISSKINDKEKEKQLIELFEDSVDINWIGRFALGRYWNDISEETRSDYLKSYRAYLLASYIPKFRQYTNQEFVLKGVYEESGEYIVKTEIKNPDGADIRVDYKIRISQGGSYKIFDIAAEGISLITTQRADFGSILARNGVKKLIKLLDKKAG